MVKLKVDWADYIVDIAALGNQIRCQLELLPLDEHYDVILGLTRGGLIPAVWLSHFLNVPMFAFNPHNLNTEGKARSLFELPINPGIVSNVLVVDDISDTGKTLDKVAKFLSNRGFHCATATVYINKTRTVHEPKYAVHNSENKWVVFPYETD